jgi:inosine/xanthosine triphosphate pyrophosphatase family protein/diadenosine tetraphosphate (Ap4A) HIT family hydrolase
MLTLVTTNPLKYEPFAHKLEQMRILVVPPKGEVPELQSLTFTEAISHKARMMTELFGRPVLVDDAGLVLEAYPSFPGPLTSVVLRSLGEAGLRRLLHGVSDRSTMECHIGCWNGKTLRTWSGKVAGRLDLSKHASSSRMLLTDLFVSDQPSLPGSLSHRSRALEELESSALELHLESAEVTTNDSGYVSAPVHQCPFCVELENAGTSIFTEMIGGRLSSRIVYEDENFVVMPPLGQFMEGGLLLMTRRHIPSFAHLPPHLFEFLERLLAVIRRELKTVWGTSPLIFEHGPAPQRTKGVCCVEHAHFNIFPARVAIRPHFAGRMSMPLSSLSELSKLRHSEFGYLFVEENDCRQTAFDAHLVPTQLIRRIITADLGIPDRWHWRDYPGCDELVATYHKLKDRIQS